MRVHRKHGVTVSCHPLFRGRVPKMKDKTACHARFPPCLSCEMRLPDPWLCADNGRMNGKL
jgi:hypothetical protein